MKQLRKMLREYTKGYRHATNDIANIIEYETRGMQPILYNQNIKNALDCKPLFVQVCANLFDECRAMFF